MAKWALVNTTTNTLILATQWDAHAFYRAGLTVGIAVMQNDVEPSTNAIVLSSTHSIVPVVTVAAPLLAGQVADVSTWAITATSATETIPAIYPPLATIQANQIFTLGMAYQNASRANVAYMGATFQADSASQDNLQKTLLVYNASGATPTGFYWVDAVNAQVPMTLAQLLGLAQAMLTAGWLAFQHLQAQKTAVRAATTPAGVLAVVW